MHLHLRVLLLLALVLVFAGCAPRETPADAGVRTGTLIIGNGAEPADLDPQTMTAYTDGNIHMALFEGLTALDEEKLTPLPSSAERWDVSEDGLTWTFHLRETLRWSNGEPVTADDFVQSWRRLVSPAIAADNAYLLYPVKNAEAINGGSITDLSQLGVTAPDARTLVVTLEQPTPYFAMLTANVATFALNPRVLEKFGAMERRGTAWTRPGNLVGSGPFQLKEWAPNQRVVVEKNPHHWDATSVALSSIVFLPTDNPDVDERNFRAGQVHATLSLPTAKVAGWRERDPAKLRIDPLSQANFIRFNTTRPPFDDVRVRRAFALSIDRETLARTVLQGTRAAATALTPPNTGGYTARAKVPTDFETARRLLAEAGFPGGRDFPEVELACRNDEIQPKLAEAMQAMWQRELGVRITLTQSEQKIWLQNQQSRSYTLSFGSWLADVPDPGNFLGLFRSDGGYNWTGWSDPDYDRLIAEAEPLADPPRREELFQQAEARLLEAAPITPVFNGAATYLLDPRVEGWPPSQLGWRRYQLVRFRR